MITPNEVMSEPPPKKPASAAQHRAGLLLQDPQFPPSKGAGPKLLKAQCPQRQIHRPLLPPPAPCRVTDWGPGS